MKNSMMNLNTNLVLIAINLIKVNQSSTLCRLNKIGRPEDIIE